MANTLGNRRIIFAIVDLDVVVARLRNYLVVGSWLPRQVLRPVAVASFTHSAALPPLGRA